VEVSIQHANYSWPMALCPMSASLRVPLREVVVKVSRCFPILAVVFFSTSLFAAKHPIPLDPNTSADKCIECHADKTQGAYVHSAMSMGCMACHEIRVIKSHDKKHEDITRVKLIKATATGQCLTCHEDMKGSADKSTVHAPVTRNCLTCHDPHNSKYKNQLLKPAEGGKDENLCLQCHIQGLNVPKDGSRHAALDMGCATCHITHKIGEKDKRENQFHLVKDAPALCKDCHDPTDAALKKAHHNQPFGNADCLGCHDAHQSYKPKLAQLFRHAPFESGDCDTCHAEAKDGKVVLTTNSSRDLCVTCHDEQAKQIANAKAPHPGAQGECIACHSPHASQFDRLLKDPVKVCESCHPLQAEMHRTKGRLHAAAYRDGCYTCHNGHGGENPTLLRAEGNRLCLECHSPNRRPRFDPATGALTIFNGAVRLRRDYFTSLPPLDLQAGDVMGHPLAGHPVLATIDRSDPEKKRPMTCLSCHHAHAGAFPNMLVTDTNSSMPLCGRCHNAAAPPPPNAITNTPVPTQPAGKKKKKEEKQQ